MGARVTGRWASIAPQIHDRGQAADFARNWKPESELAFLRFEAGVAGGKALRFVDLLFYHPHADQVFVLLGSVLGGDGSLLFPDLVRGWDPAVLDRIAETIRSEVARVPPGHLEVRPVHRSVVPFDVNSLTIERVLPGVRDYCTAVNHIKRYRFARGALRPGRVLDCACGTGYGASMLLHRRDVTGYVGVDLSDFAVGFSRKLVKDPRASFVQRLLAEVDGGPFENVVSLETIEHVPDPHAFLRDLAAKLSPEGQLVLSLPAERWGGSHRNPYHLTNWNYARFERMVSGAFREVKIFQQRLSLLGPDTFGASEIFDRDSDEREDECFIALLQGPREGRRRRVVVRRRFAIGDTIWATPVVSAARARYPERDIVAVTDATQVFHRNPDADLVVTTAFRPREDDLFIDLDGAYEADRSAHILEAYRAAAGFPVGQVRPSLHPGEDDYRPVLETLEKLGWQAAGVERVVAAHMASASPDRIWPERHWKRILEELLSDRRVGVIFVGGPDDLDPGSLALPAAVMPRTLSVRNRDQLLMTAAAIAIADLFVGPDSGLSHVAAAVGTRGVILYGMADPKTRLPLDGSAVGIWSDAECRGCLHDLPADRAPLCRLEQAVCMERIDPALVQERVRGILATLPAFEWDRRARFPVSCLSPRNQPALPPPGRPPAVPHEDSANPGRLGIAVLSVEDPRQACPQLRLISPLISLSERIDACWAGHARNSRYEYDPSLLKAADLIIVQREFPTHGTRALLESILRSGKPVVYEMDDLLIDLPHANPNRERMDSNREEMIALLRRADALTVSTEELAACLREHNPNVYVLPNRIDPGIWKRSVRNRTEGPVVIGYAGTATHREDLEMIEEALAKISGRHGDTVAFRFLGYATDRISALPGFRFLPFRRSYREYAAALRESGIDIAVAPLVDSRFNRCKSNIKWLEYSACGIPGVFSDLPPYHRDIRNGENGFLAGPDPAEWVRAIEALLLDHGKRTAIGKTAMEEVFAKYSLPAGAQPYLDGYREIATGGTKREDRSPKVSIIIPVFNELGYTKQCLRALADASGPYPACEIIVADDGSTDDTPSFLAAMDGQIHVVRNPVNGGFARACNAGAKAARGEYLLFLNNDTVPKPGWLKSLVEAAERQRADICGGRLLYPDGTVQHAGVAFNEDSVPCHIFRGFPAGDPAVTRRRVLQCVTAACMLVKRSLFESLGGFDEEYRNGFEDVDFCLRAGDAGGKILYVPESVVLHHEESTPERKDHDRGNLDRFLGRWRGKVRCDARSIYAEEGWVKISHPDGTAHLERAPAGRTAETGPGRPPAPAG